MFKGTHRFRFMSLLLLIVCLMLPVCTGQNGNGNDNVTMTATAALSPVVPTSPVAGLVLDVFTTVSNNSALVLFNAKPNAEQVVTSFQVGLSGLGAYQGFLFSGYIQIKSRGSYQFRLQSNGNSVLAIGTVGNVLINNSGLDPRRSTTASISLQKGYYPIYLAYVNKTGDLSFSLKYGLSGSSKQTIPASVLFHEGTPTPTPTPSPSPTPTPTPTEVWQPKPGTSWQWQITGTIDTTFAVKMYDIDLFDSPQNTIDFLHSKGIIVICYFSAGTRENWRPDASQFPSAAIGKAVQGWSGENWIDTRNAVVRAIMTARMDTAVAKHCDGLEPDNVDAYTNSNGLGLTAATQIDYNTFLASEAHKRNLSVGLKNDVDQVNQLVGYFDWVLDEECFKYSECDTLLPFTQAGKAVFEVEYGTQSTANSVCPKANALNFDTLIKDMDLDAFRISCR